VCVCVRVCEGERETVNSITFSKRAEQRSQIPKDFCSGEPTFTGSELKQECVCVSEFYQSCVDVDLLTQSYCGDSVRVRVRTCLETFMFRVQSSLQELIVSQ